MVVVAVAHERLRKEEKQSVRRVSGQGARGSDKLAHPVLFSLKLRFGRRRYRLPGDLCLYLPPRPRLMTAASGLPSNHPFAMKAPSRTSLCYKLGPRGPINTTQRPCLPHLPLPPFRGSGTSVLPSTAPSFLQCPGKYRGRCSSKLYISLC